jgi:hypothetical protein
MAIKSKGLSQTEVFIRLQAALFQAKNTKK